MNTYRVHFLKSPAIDVTARELSVENNLFVMEDQCGENVFMTAIDQVLYIERLPPTDAEAAVEGLAQAGPIT